MTTRSDIMRAVRSTNTTPELIVRRLAHSMGYRFRLYRSDLPGSPDLVFPSRRKVIFVHGCFWHGHSCKRGAREPKTNSKYWRQKINRNRARDALVQETLTTSGWQSMVIWECEATNGVELIASLTRFLEDQR